MCIRDRPNYKDYTSLNETSYKADGLRSILLKKNSAAVREVNDLKKQKADLKISEVSINCHNYFSTYK